MSLYDLGGGGSPPSSNNDLAMLLAQHMAMSNMGAGGAPQRSPTQGASDLGNSLVMWALQHPQEMQGIRDGIGNLFSGNAWDGMAGMGTMPGLNAQAAGNISGGAAGL